MEREQRNDTAGTQTTLEALLRVHPRDDILILSHNQGCVDTTETLWVISTMKQESRAIRMRIQRLLRYREEMGADTGIRWVHSHVEDGDRATTEKSKYVCACKQDKRIECDPKHWAHTGNERTDAVSKEGADEPQLGTRWEQARGELEFILHSNRHNPETSRHTSFHFGPSQHSLRLLRKTRLG